jgi:L-asparaginase/Glu-tRNA(Gln) amidotransferase subunit D
MARTELADAAVAVMVEVARTSGLGLDPATQQDHLDRLIAGGLVVILDTNAPSGRTRYALSPEGQRWLDERGVGANES